MSRSTLRPTFTKNSLRCPFLIVGGIAMIANAGVAAAAPPRVSANRSATAIPSSQPETKALDAELLRLRNEAKTAEKQIARLQSDVRAARKDVQRAIKVTTAIRNMDIRLDRLIDRLEVYRSVPNVRTAVKVLVENLKKLKKSIASVRRKSDPVEKRALRPLAKKLKTFEYSLRKPIRTLKQAVLNVDKARASLLTASRVAQRQRTARRALEQSSRFVRPSATTLANTINRFNREAFAVRKDIYSVRTQFASFWTVERSLASMSRSMAPGEKVAGDLDRVLCKRISIKVPLTKKYVRFTIRQILETPGKVLDIVLKPLEKIARAALKPVLRKMNIRIPPPKGLAAMSRSLDQLTRNESKLSKSMTSLDRKAQRELQPQFDSLVRLLVKQRLN